MAKKKKIKKGRVLVKPSELKKDSRVSLRINSEVKEKFAKEGLSIQELFDRFLDTLVKIEVETKLTIETKKK